MVILIVAIYFSLIYNEMWLFLLFKVENILGDWYVWVFIVVLGRGFWGDKMLVDFRVFGFL